MTSLWLFGCGKMGSAMLDAWLQNPAIDSYIIINHKIDALTQKYKDSKKQIHYFRTLDDAIASNLVPDIFIFAIKPHQVEETLPALKPFFQNQSPLILSLIVGKTISFYEKHLNSSIRFIRSMPNLPCAIGKGVIGLRKNENITPQDKSLTTDLLAPLGEVIWLKNEAMIDALTAISGSGPAYLFLFAEGLTKAGIKMGFDKQTAERLTNQTLLGSSALLAASPFSAETLRCNVTSPNGTTAKAIETFLNEKATLTDLIHRAVENCKNRAIEISNES